MDIKKLKPTFFSILSVIGIIIGIPFGLYGLTLSGGASLGGVLILGGVIGLVILLAIDRALASTITPKKLSIYELIISIAFLMIYFFKIRQ